jgi:hypothetical protein
MLDELELAMMTPEQATAHAAACYQVWYKAKETSALFDNQRRDAFIALTQARNYCAYPASRRDEDFSFSRCTACNKNLEVKSL